MPAAPNITSLAAILSNLATGSPDGRVIGTKRSPGGIETVIEYRSKWPVYLNVTEWVDTFLVIQINGLESADLRSSAQQNPGEHGETPGDALWGGRTLVLNGKVFAHTIWKLRDMKAGLFGAFLEVDTEYPLIFHAADPRDDLMIMCKLADKPSMPDQQTTRNEYVRDFQIALRASNPRFLTVVPERTWLTAVTDFVGSQSFDLANPVLLESFTLSQGLSSGYGVRGQGIQVNEGVSPGADMLQPREVIRNMIVNPRGDVGALPALTAIDGIYDDSAADNGNVTFQAAGGIANGPYFLTTVAVGHTLAGIVFDSHITGSAPPVMGGETLRITGWVYLQSAPTTDAYIGVKLWWWTYPEDGPITRIDAPIFETDGGAVDVGHIPGNSWVAFTGKWLRIDKTIVAPVQPGVRAFPSAQFYFANAVVPGNQIGAFAFRVAEPMLDLDRDPTRGVLYGDGSYLGWKYEGVDKQSLARRSQPIANMLRNTKAYVSWNAQGVSGPGTNPTERIISGGNPAEDNNFVGHTTWWRSTSNGAGAAGIPIFPDGTTKLPMGLQQESVRVAEKTTYNFSFYVRARTVPRRIYAMASFIAPTGNAVIPAATFIPVQTHGNDGKDAVGEWRRFWVDIPVPAGAISMIPTAFWATDDANPIPSGEEHEIGAMMLRMGAGPRSYIDSGGVVAGRTLPEYTPTQTGLLNDSITLGPWAFRNLLVDNDMEKADTSSLIPIVSTLAKVAMGGPVDSGMFTRATAQGASAFMGLGINAVVSERTQHAATAYVRLPPGSAGVRSAVIKLIWYQDVVDDAHRIGSSESPWVSITDKWTEIKFENVMPPDKASIAQFQVGLVNPVIGNQIDIDKVALLNKPVSDGWFGYKSEWAWPGPQPYGETLRYNYSAYTTPRSDYIDGSQTAKIIVMASSQPDDYLHMAVSYFDDDNQIYIEHGYNKQLKIIRRSLGVATELIVYTVPAEFYVNGATNFARYVRARLKDGVVFAEICTHDLDTVPLGAPSAPGVTFKQIKWVLSEADRRKYEEAPHAMRFGMQVRNANWKIDEWRYGDMMEPQGWKYYAGGGTVTTKGGKLMPLDMTPKFMVRSGLAYKVEDGIMEIKFRRSENPNEGERFTVGLGAKVLDKDNFLYAVYDYITPVTGQITAQIGLQFGVCINGVRSNFVGSEATMPNTDLWLQLSVIGDLFKVLVWNTDPVLGGAAWQTVQVTLGDGIMSNPIDKTLFGAGKKGDFGIIWDNPRPTNNGIEYFKFEVPKFDDIAYKLLNRGNYEAQTTIELTGPMTNPRVTNEANGKSFLINATIPAGETWVLENVGATKRFYRKSDGANRFKFFDQTSMWITLEPNNVANNLRLTATGLGTGWDFSVVYHHTFM